MTAAIERVETHGVFSLDGQDFEVDNNIWLVGDANEVIVLDAAHDHRPILDAIAGRRVRALVCTHAHNDHVNAAPELADATGAPILLHPDDTMLWRMAHATRRVDAPLVDGRRLEVAGVELEVLHTPGHSPGGICLWAPTLGVVFSGDTLFRGGPGATGRSFSDRDTLLASIRTRLLPLPGGTVVNPGHGDSTTIDAEAPAIR